MKVILYLLILIPGFLKAQDENVSENGKVKVFELDNAKFRKDNYWRGADGAATVGLGSGKILWLFSDTFIDQDGTKRRSNSKTMIRNSIAIQNGNSFEDSLTFYYKGTKKEPKDFFEVPGENWFWTGHGILLKGKLVIFLIEETKTNSGFGFESVGWYVAIIDNPFDNPNEWKIKYVKPPETFGVVVGSSAVLEDKKYVYAYGVKEPGTHETYLIRFNKNKLTNGDLSDLEWWIDNKWTGDVSDEPKSSALFIGQTEFSVYYEKEIDKYVQFQTYGFGKASIGYRLAEQLYGPWSEPVMIYTPSIGEDKEFVYTANAHPEYKGDGIIVTYNINSFDLERVMTNEKIYFPKVIKIEWDKDK
jgi:hypothetical protein